MGDVILTVSEELRRRDGCRYGLIGVTVRIAGNPVLYSILSNHWTDGGDEFTLGLVLIPADCFAEYVNAQPRMMTAAELDKYDPNYPAGTITDADSRMVRLVGKWPHVCGCYNHNIA